jgi:predicted RNase H-like nuclease (RuvC/YqgF family)
MKLLKLLVLILLSFNLLAQKVDVRVEIFDLKEEVAKLKSENQKMSDEFRISQSKYENRIVDLGTKIEDLRFEINVLKRMLEQFRGTGSTNPNLSSSLSDSNRTASDSEISEKTETKPRSQSSSQCSAITKKGTRCSRSARSNGLCWQHGG